MIKPEDDVIMPMILPRARANGAQPVLYVTEVHEVNEPNALKAVTSPHLRCQRAPPSTWCSSRHSPMVMVSADEVIE